MDIVAMIPARSGSEGLPDKNIKELCGRPLMDYSIKAALACDRISAVYVNSDSQAYLDLAAQLGAQTFLRTRELAQNDISMSAVVTNFIDGLIKQGKMYDAIVVLYPVYPLRTSDDLHRMIAEFEKAGAERPLVGLKVPDTHPYLCYQIDERQVPSPVIDHDSNIFFRRQTYPPCYEFSLWACVLPVQSLPTLNAQLMHENAYGYKIPEHIKVVDIDTPSDFEYAEFLIRKNQDIKGSRVE